MPYRTKSGSHYHETYGCCGAMESCTTEGLEPCAICCGRGSKAGSGPGPSAGAVGGGSPNSGAIAVDSEIIGVTDATVGGVRGTLYKLDRLLDPDERRAISALEGARTVIVAAQYAPELRRTAVFVEDGYSYSVGRAEEIADIGITAMADPMSAPDVDLSVSDGGTSGGTSEADLDDLTINSVDPSDSRALTGVAWRIAQEEAREQMEADALVTRERTLMSIEDAVVASMSRDYDVSDESYYIAGQVRTLLEACDVRPNTSGKRDTYTMTLASQYVVFAAGNEGYIGGSAADYCAAHAMDALEGYEIRLRDNADADEILARIRKGIDETALYKDREYGELGGAGVPIFRTEYADEERASQGIEGRRLSRMSKRSRVAMWQAEASEWADRWVATRELQGEGRATSAISFREFRQAKEAATDDARTELARADKRVVRKYGEAYTESMVQERRSAYSGAMSKALRTLSSRKQMAEQHARLHEDALRTVNATRDYDEHTRIADLHPEERRQLALLAARAASDGHDVPAFARAKAQGLWDAFESGTIGDLGDLAGGDPVALADAACADAMIAMRARGQASPRVVAMADRLRDRQANVSFLG